MDNSPDYYNLLPSVKQVKTDLFGKFSVHMYVYIVCVHA